MSAGCLIGSVIGGIGSAILGVAVGALLGYAWSEVMRTWR